jgi:hypothetical protein
VLPFVKSSTELTLPGITRIEVNPRKTRCQSQKKDIKQQPTNVAETIDTANNNNTPQIMNTTLNTETGEFYGFSRLDIRAAAIVHASHKDLSSNVPTAGGRGFKQRNINQMAKAKAATKRSQAAISSSTNDHFVAQCVGRTGPTTRSRRNEITDRAELDFSKPSTQAPPRAKKMRK